MRILRLLVLGLAVLALTVPFGLDSCSIAPPTAIFATSKGPADETTFLGGELGVLQRTYKKPYLFAAYRILSGVPPSAEEAASLREVADPPHIQPEYNVGSHWTFTRERITAAGPAPRLEVYKTVAHDGYQYSFRNCQEAAFDTASAAYEELAEKWGSNDPKLLEWVRAQDQAFANCSGGPPQIPAEPAPDADPVFAGYRRYQIAAATFYAGRYRDASRMFLQIAHDDQNPWRGAGLYLSARALLRGAMFDGDQAALGEAKEQLQAVLKDPELDEWHDRARGLLQWWQLRLEPKARLLELDAVLRAPHENITQALIDFFYLLDRRPWPAADDPEAEASGELAAWMFAMSPNPPRTAGAESVERWRNTGSPAWLIAALLNAPDSDLAPLSDAARRMAPDSPGFESAMYYAISRELAGGHRQSARQLADRVLRRDLTLSSRNLILGLRTRLAANWNQFLRFGPRVPEPGIQESEDAEVSADHSPLPTGVEPVFDHDVISAFNHGVPLSLWIDASRNPVLPKYMQLRIAEAGWMRAVMLSRDAEAKLLLERVAVLEPGAAKASRAYLTAQNPADARFAAVYLVLRTPALRPVLQVPELDVPNLISPRNVATDAYGYRIRCWGYGGKSENPGDGMLAFLGATERDAAALEWKKIGEAQPWEATLLLRETIEYAGTHREDPRIPEALHRAVLGSYYRCGDADTGKYSKQAFLLLHRQYPNSQWTTRTPYWYK